MCCQAQAYTIAEGGFSGLYQAHQARGMHQFFCCQLQDDGLLTVACVLCSKPVKQNELLARISAQLRVKADATWVQSIVKGVLEDDSEAMNILQTILPEPIISRIQV